MIGGGADKAISTIVDDEETVESSDEELPS